MALYVLEGDFSDKNLLHALKRSLQYVNGKKIVVLEEPIQQCQPKEGHFELYYKNPKKYAFFFQLLVLSARCHLLKKTVEENPDAVIIMERSPLSDLNVFTRLHFETGNISSDEHFTYMAVYNALNQFHIMGIFYLKVLEDGPTPKEYYESFIRNTDVEVLTLDWQTLPSMVEIVRDTIAADFPNYQMWYLILAVWFGILLFFYNLFF